MNVTSYRSPKTEVRKSPIHGRGLFAKERIKKGEVLGIKGGHIIDETTREKYKEVINDSEMQITDDFYIAPLSKDEFEEVMIFVNHSCEPNGGILGNIIFSAMRDIEPGEEITSDYALHQTKLGYRLECNCGLQNCRKIIRGTDWKNKKLQEKYGNYFSSYILEKIRG